ncbi:MAG: Gfo/Idh/MocA family oxidoreductase [Verrucomicrobiales bacterium]|nr:Gfo/Idh/MocA family oxidoreductase [Verrucomicrobiales bacterium]
MATRRDLIRASAAATAFAAPAFVRGQNLNSKLQLASIGSDNKGFSDIRAMSTHDKQQYVALCDVDTSRFRNAKKLWPDVPTYQDFRVMLTEMGDKIDAVTVSTPDHMHAYCAIWAMKQGKHVYCQKPLTHNIWEAKEVVKMAKKSGVITRLGNQIHSHKFYRTAVQIVQSGAIGKVSRVHSWVGSTGHGKSGFISRPKDPPPLPETVDWDLWIGTAPMRPYGGKGVYHAFGWRDWQDFGNGSVGDFGCHILDPVYTALKITGAGDQFSAHHSGLNDEVWPAQTSYSFTVPGTEYTEGDRLKINWYDGGRLPNTKGSHIPDTTRLPSSGSILIGDKGTLVIPHVQAPRLYPAENYADGYEMADDQDHYHGWIDGCLTGEQPSDGFDYGALLTETILMGNIAVRYPKEVLEWDSEAMKITNKPEANQWLTREYREGWDLKKLIG